MDTAAATCRCHPEVPDATNPGSDIAGIQNDDSASTWRATANRDKGGGGGVTFGLSQSTDSGFLEAEPPTPETPPAEEELSPPADEDGSNLGMLFRRSTLRRGKARDLTVTPPLGSSEDRLLQRAVDLTATMPPVGRKDELRLGGAGSLMSEDPIAMPPCDHNEQFVDFRSKDLTARLPSGSEERFHQRTEGPNAIAMPPGDYGDRFVASGFESQSPGDRLLPVSRSSDLWTEDSIAEPSGGLEDQLHRRTKDLTAMLPGGSNDQFLLTVSGNQMTEDPAAIPSGDPEERLPVTGSGSRRTEEPTAIAAPPSNSEVWVLNSAGSAGGNQRAKTASRSGSGRRNVQFAVTDPALRSDVEPDLETVLVMGATTAHEPATTTTAPPAVDADATPPPPQTPPGGPPQERAPLPQGAVPSFATGGLHRETEEERGVRVGGFWPHSPSSLFATLTCTVGMFDICRFSYLSFQYGGGFILQFLMLTVVFGLPMLSFQMSVGQYLGAGIMDMWKVSPIFYGVGVSSIISMALYGVYNVIPVSWMFVYFRDSFVTNVSFKWGECRNVYGPEECLKYGAINNSDVFERAIPSYFQNRVLMRQPFGNATGNSNDLVFENVFNLAVIWMVIFICLSKGIKSYGKVVLAFGIFPMLSFYLLSIELLRRASSGAEIIMSRHTDMTAFFLNGWSWLAAAREVFFIWGMNGAAIMQIASHNKHRHNLKRDCAIVIVVTLSIILLSAFLACACIFIIYKYDRAQHMFVPSSFETLSTSRFLLPSQVYNQLDIRMEDFASTNYLVGVESVAYNGDTSRTSGHQVARFATELYPTALVALTPARVSAFWPVLFYLCLITFGIAQQLAIWKCVVEGVIAIYPEKLRSWETSITFMACVFGFVLGLPFVTQVGVYVVHFMDVCIGSAWWIMLIYLVQIFALLLIRGRPYTSEDIVVVLTNSPVMKRWLAPVISFSWNVVLPITFLVLAITSFKLGDFGHLFFWDNGNSYVFWPLWAKQVGAFIQILPIVVIPSVCLIQIMRYMGKNTGIGFVQRFEALVRPAPTLLPCIPDGFSASGHSHNGLESPPSSGTDADSPAARDDPPPKYTPPPSYNTATGLKLLKRLNSLRASFRRSQRSQRSCGVDRRTQPDVEMQRTAGAEPPSPPSAPPTQGGVGGGVGGGATAVEVSSSDVPPSYSAVVDARAAT